MTSPLLDVVARLRSAGCVFAEEEAELLLAAAATPADLVRLVEERVGGAPLEQVLGWAELAGLRVAVEPGVFVPRQRSVVLVQAAVARGGAVVVDLCCGSGALGAAVAAGLGTALRELHAVDVDPVAVRCARRNLAAAGGRVHRGDLYAALPAALRGRVDLLLANAPYVPTGALGLLPPEARLHEPPVALDGGADGLDVQRRVAAGAADWLAPGGTLLVETSEEQADRTAALLAGHGLATALVQDAEIGGTVVTGTRPRA